MGSQLSKFRNTKMKVQNGLCYYCRQPMWIDGLGDFAKRFGLSLRNSARFRCTAEHLHARCEGGTDVQYNIVAACLYCNQTRHRSRKPLAPDAFATKVRNRIAAGKWHGFVATGARG